MLLTVQWETENFNVVTILINELYLSITLLSIYNCRYMYILILSMFILLGNAMKSHTIKIDILWSEWIIENRDIHSLIWIRKTAL